ncbi:alanine racemase [Microbacterium sp. Root53]|uniref:alanine racemase n=1 Tax=Microbacterium sp. Root53 TaxID=1736553 RepID=UPI000A4CEF71|nr:alanine racemase C-terminal domain-containing protein [Microbacterium sp. Root53]
MTWPNPRRPLSQDVAHPDAAAAPSPLRSAPLARVSRAALRANAARMRAAGGDPVADLRRDAWGHGVETVGRAVCEAGIVSVAVDARDIPVVEALGLRAVDVEPDPSDVLYGLPGTAGEPALELVTPVLSTKPLLAGEAVSYGYTHRATADTTIALIAGGYAEGVVRALGNRVGVELRGRLCPIVGRVAMDVCVIDVGDLDVAPGDEAVYFGSGAVADALSAWAGATGLTPAELVCAVGLHVEREAVS